MDLRRGPSAVQCRRAVIRARFGDRRKVNPTVRIIAARGLPNVGLFREVSDHGVQHFLTKPFTTEALRKVLQEVLADT